MNILAIDLGTRTGWCSGDHEAGTEDFSIRRGESSGMRFVRFRSWLMAILSTTIDHERFINLVAYEEINFFRGIDASLVYGGMLGILQEVCTQINMDYKGVMPSELKKWATGKGNANKDLMMATAAMRWPSFSGDDNEADARLLWAFARESWG